MTLEQQVTNLELSRRLKELMVKQESIFFWHDYKEPIENRDQSFISQTNEIWFDPAFEDVYSAFTASEIGELLPSGFVVWSFSDRSGFGVECSEYYRAGRSYGEKYTEHAETLPDAMARMLVYLIENGLVKV